MSDRAQRKQETPGPDPAAGRVRAGDVPAARSAESPWATGSPPAPVAPTLTPFRCADCRTALVRLVERSGEGLLACLQCGATGNYAEAVDYGGFREARTLTRQQRARLRRQLDVSGR
jgi:hypothetical protein